MLFLINEVWEQNVNACSYLTMSKSLVIPAFSFKH